MKKLKQLIALSTCFKYISSVQWYFFGLQKSLQIWMKGKSEEKRKANKRKKKKKTKCGNAKIQNLILRLLSFIIANIEPTTY